MIYLDSSALLKLVRHEAETPALVLWLHDRQDQPRVTSELGRVEVLRAARRVDARTTTRARALMAAVDLVPLTRAVQDVACLIGDEPLRTPDAIHLASASLLGNDLTALVAYDHRLHETADQLGLPTAAPGQPRP